MKTTHLRLFPRTTAWPISETIKRAFPRTMLFHDAPGWPEKRETLIQTIIIRLTSQLYHLLRAKASFVQSQPSRFCLKCFLPSSFRSTSKTNTLNNQCTFIHSLSSFYNTLTVSITLQTPVML